MKTSDSTVTERIKAFNKYLHYLFANINIFLIDEVLNFIFLKKELIQLFIKKYYMLKIYDDNNVLISLKKAYEKIKQNEELQFENERTKRNNNINNINIIENQNGNYYDAILDYEMKRQKSFDWEENKNVTPNSIVIKEFLINLSEDSENKTEILQTFESFLNKGIKWTKLSPKEILILYTGEEGINNKNMDNKTVFINNIKRNRVASDYKYHSFTDFFSSNDDNSFNENEEEYFSLNYDNKLNGLFYRLGNYSNNIILSIGALDLLNKLMDTEYNPDAEIYIKIFQSCEIRHYKMLNLNKIIKNNVGGNKNNLKALKLLKLIFSDKNRDEHKRKIMEDDIVYKQYLNYLNKFIE